MSSAPALDPRPRPAPVGTGFRLTVFAVALLVSLGYVVARSRTAAAALARLDQQLSEENARARKFAYFRNKASEYQQLTDRFATSAVLIQSLMSAQTSPAKALAALGQGLRRAPDVNILAVEFRGPLDVAGQAQPDSLQNFRTAIEKAGGLSCAPLPESSPEEKAKEPKNAFFQECVVPKPAGNTTPPSKP